MKRSGLHLSTFFLAWIIALCAAASAYAIPFPWPDSNRHPRVILTADQTVLGYMQEHPDWFRDDFLIAGLTISDVPYGESDTAMAQFGRLFNLFHEKNIFTGTYISGTTAVHELSLRKYPANAASIEDISFKAHYLGPWMREPEQQVIDLKDAFSRTELEKAIRILWLHVHVVMRFVDYAAVHPRVAGMQPWNVYCANIAALRAAAEAGHANAIFNVFARPWEMSDDEIKQLTNAVGGNGSNGISFPLPWSKAIKDDKIANAWAIYRYRQILDRHIVLILIPSDDAPIEALFNWVYTWKRPGDRIYFAAPFYEAPPG